MKITRRTLLSTATAMAALAQAPPPMAAPVADYLTTSADTNKRNAEAIAKVTLPQATEPAFSFRA